MFLLSSVYIAFTFLFDIWSTEHFNIITENVLFGQIRFRKVKTLKFSKLESIQCAKNINS